MCLHIMNDETGSTDFSDRIDRVDYNRSEDGLSIRLVMLPDMPLLFPAAVRGLTINLNASEVLSAASMLVDHEHGLDPAERVHVEALRQQALVAGLNSVQTIQKTQVRVLDQVSNRFQVVQQRLDGVVYAESRARCSLDCILDLLHHTGVRRLYGLLRTLRRKCRRGGDDDMDIGRPTAG